MSFYGVLGIESETKTFWTSSIEPGLLLSCNGKKPNEFHIQASFVKAAGLPALMQTDQLDSSLWLNMTENQVRDCHKRRMKRSVTNDGNVPVADRCASQNWQVSARGTFLELQHPICLLLCLDILKPTPSNAREPIFIVLIKINRFENFERENGRYPRGLQNQRWENLRQRVLGSQNSFQVL